MNLMHDNIKIKYVDEGYLPNWPYHLISDEEMFDAFLSDIKIDKSGCKYVENYYKLTGKPSNWDDHYDVYYIKDGDEYYPNSESTWSIAYSRGIYEKVGEYSGSKFESGSGFFVDYYPLLSPKVEQAYCDIIEVMQHYITEYLNQLETSGEPNDLPAWIYGFMLGSVISVNSDYRDIHDLIKPMGVDNIDDEFTKAASEKCYQVSRMWVQKTSHCAYSEKYLCLTGDFEYGTHSEVAAILRDNSIAYTFSFFTSVDYVVVGGTGENIDSYIIDSARSYGIPVITEAQLMLELDKIVVSVTGGVATRELMSRPPTMFGEPHVVKAMRLLEVNPNAKWGTYPYQE